MRPKARSIPGHDEYFRENFSDPAAAAGLIRLAAPPEVVAQLELDKLAPLPTAQFDPDMGKRIPDLLFECPARSRRIIVSILFEHKSSPDYQIALQFLRYMLLDHERRCQDKPVKPALVLPILVYHGQRQWKPNLSLVAERHVPTELQKYILRVPALVLDLKHIDDETLDSDQNLDDHSRATLLAMKHIFQGSPGQDIFLRRLAQRIRSVPMDNRMRFLERTILYLVHMGRVQRCALEPLEEELNEDLAMRYKSGYQMDMDEAFQKGEAKGIEQGIEQGIGQGIEQGIEQGLLQGLDLNTIEVVHNMLAQGFEWNAIESITHLNETSYIALKQKRSIEHL